MEMTKTQQSSTTISPELFSFAKDVTELAVDNSQTMEIQALKPRQAKTRSLKSVVSTMGRVQLHNFCDREISGVSCDSRTVERGNLFIAVPGVKVAGAKFAQDAIANGAIAVVTDKALALPNNIAQVIVRDVRKAVSCVTEEFFRKPTTRVKLLGVTGTAGKSTTTYMIHHILNSYGKKADMFTTLKYKFGGKEVPAPQTTPDAVTLTKMINDASEAGSEYIAMEVSSHSLAQSRVEASKFHCGIFTNLASDHLDYHKTVEEYKKAKGLLFEKLSRADWAVLNADDPASEYYLSKTKAITLKYSTKSPADLGVKIHSATVDGIVFDLSLFRLQERVSMPVIGLHNVENALAAAGTAVSCGVPLSEIAKALSNFTGVPGRLQRVDICKDFSVFVDYAHTEGSLATMLANVRPFTKNRLIVVFGCGGDRDTTKRPKMAAAAKRLADLSIVTTDNPRSEDPEIIISEVLAGFDGREKYIVEADRKKAIELALSLAGKGDVVVIAGKGHENYQIFSDRTEHFDDCETVRQLLA